MKNLPEKVKFTNKKTGKSLTFTKSKPFKKTPGSRLADNTKKYG